MLDFEHRHRCEGCQLVWEHDPGTGVGNGNNRHHNGGGLTAPHCGSAVRSRHKTEGGPTSVYTQPEIRVGIVKRPLLENKGA
jgi:hypothetical protein